jgi:glutaredoxin
MDSFTVYIKQGCVFCDLVIAILEFDGKAVNVVDVDQYPEALDDLKQQGLKTLPQTYRNGKHIGGYRDLVSYSETSNY